MRAAARPPPSISERARPRRRNIVRRTAVGPVSKTNPGARRSRLLALSLPCDLEYTAVQLCEQGVATEAACRDRSPDAIEI